jgi:hypothetical protein
MKPIVVKHVSYQKERALKCHHGLNGRYSPPLYVLIIVLKACNLLEEPVGCILPTLSYSAHVKIIQVGFCTFSDQLAIQKNRKLQNEKRFFLSPLTTLSTLHCPRHEQCDDYER